jgi:ANTAR domain
VGTDRRIRLWRLVAEQANGAPVALEHLLAIAVSVTNVDSAAVAVTVSATLRETVHVSDPVAAVLEELALTLGEGPGVDALTGSMVLAADINEASCLARWPVFAPAAALAGVCAVFALPLRIGGIRLGVMDLYRTAPGDLDQEQLADALMLADTACGLLLDAADQVADRRRDGGLEPLSGQHPVVHQATGMLIVQLGVNAVVAMTRLRAFAFAHDRRLRDVAADVVARRLRFEPEGKADG